MTVGISGLFGYVGSSLLEVNLNYYNWLFTWLGVCGLAKAWAIYSMPSQTLEGKSHDHPFGNLKYVVQDREFGYVLLTWFIMGFANLWILPLRWTTLLLPPTVSRRLP